MPAILDIDPLTRPPDVDLVLPGSKSITNRALVIAALADGTSRLEGTLFADDTLAMVGCLEALGVRIDVDPTERVMVVHGTSGELQGGGTLWVGQSGTTARFLLPLAAMASGGAVVDGADQIRVRPQRDLLVALRALGAQSEHLGGDGQLPVRLAESGLAGGAVSVSGEISSQFVSALLLAAPAMVNGLALELTGQLVSVPYIDMTVAMMRQFGAEVDVTDDRLYHVSPGRYRAQSYQIEPDASSASYFFAAAAVAGGRVTVPGLGVNSIQGDLGFVSVLSSMGADVRQSIDQTEVKGTGVLKGVDVSMKEMSDTAPTFGAIAPLASGDMRATEIGFIRFKESDRIATTVAELNKLGVDAVDEGDGFVVRPGAVSPGVVATYDDHRIAMAFAVLGLVVPGISIADPHCVAKTFPEFFDVLDSLRAAGDADLAVLALDGPAGSGKSTVARRAAERLGIQYLDTGAMYRSVTQAVLERGIEPSDDSAVADLARQIEIDVGREVVTVDGVDVTAAIRSEAVDAAVSQIAANGGVRAAMRRQQRGWARRRGGGVLEGRDIGSVVFPSARLKVYVTATLEERARRRATQAGEPYEAVLGALQTRDDKDSSRADSPLTEAADAVVLDSTGLTIEEVVDQVVEMFDG